MWVFAHATTDELCGGALLYASSFFALGVIDANVATFSAVVVVILKVAADATACAPSELADQLALS